MTTLAVLSKLVIISFTCLRNRCGPSITHLLVPLDIFDEDCFGVISMNFNNFNSCRYIMCDLVMVVIIVVVVVILLLSKEDIDTKYG